MTKSYSMKDWVMGAPRNNALHAPQATMNNPPSDAGWPLESVTISVVEKIIEMASPEMRALLLLDMCKAGPTSIRLFAAAHADTPMAGIVLHLQDAPEKSVQYVATTRVAAQLFCKKEGDNEV